MSNERKVNIVQFKFQNADGTLNAPPLSAFLVAKKLRGFCTRFSKFVSPTYTFVSFTYKVAQNTIQNDDFPIPTLALRSLFFEY